MGWFDTALSIGTTIGKIAGALSGNASGVVDYGPKGDINEQFGQVVFYNDPSSGDIYALNQSTSTSVGMTFPANPITKTSPIDIVLPGASKLPMSPAFASSSAAGIEDFEILPQASPSASDLQAGGPDVNIHASTTQLATSGTTVTVGPYFTAQFSATDRTLQVAVVGALTLTGLVLLNVRGAGNTVVRIINAVRKNQAESADDPQHITVDLPVGPGFSDGLTFIEITAAVGNFSAIGMTGVDEKTVEVMPLNDDDYAMLKGLTRRG